MFSKRILLFLLALVLLPVRLCFAHPMGNFSVNHYTKITIQSNGIQLQYFIDLAEIPTYQEFQQYNISSTDQAGIAQFLEKRGSELLNGLGLRADGQALKLNLVSKGVIFPPGAGGLPTMKMGYVFHAAFPHPSSVSGAQLTYTDNNYPGHAGWKEIVASGASSLLLTSSVPSRDRSDELSNYPTDMLSSPPQDLTASMRIIVPTAASDNVAKPARISAPPGKAAFHPEAPIYRRQRVATAHAGTTQSGALPTLAKSSPSPMHLEANRQGTARSRFTELITTQQLSVWFLLTAAIISMSLGALHALEPGHGKTIVAAYLVGSRGTARHAMLLGVIVTTAHTASVFALGAITLYASRYILPEQLYPWLGVLSGLTIAALGAYMFLRRWTGEEMDHAHTVGEMHGHWFASKQKSRADSLPPAETSTKKSISMLQLFTLGITGGIIPCPAALVVLLSAFSLHRVGFGFFLITSFSVGLAAVLIGFGLLMVYARRFMTRLQVDGPLTKRWLPVASAGFMTLLGAVIAIRAFSTTGVSAASFSQQNLGPALFIACVGLVLGVRHSTDTDHVVAISTIVTRQRGVRGAALIGGLWGLGHTLTILVVGCLIILGGVVIPPRVGLSMEFSVGLMLILLGLLNLSGLMQKFTAWFQSRSSSAKQVLDYLVPSPEASVPASVGNQSGAFFQCVRPLAIGLVHGLAGSAAVALLVLSTIHKPAWAIVYLVIFGAGTMLGMMCMTMAMSMPLAYAGDRLPQLSRYLTTASGVVSVCFGSFLVYQLGFIGGLFTSHPHWTPQ